MKPYCMQLSKIQVKFLQSSSKIQEKNLYTSQKSVSNHVFQNILIICMTVSWKTKPIQSRKFYRVVCSSPSVVRNLLLLSLVEFQLEVGIDGVCQGDTVFPQIVSALEQFPPLNSFRTCMYCGQRSQYIRLNSKKNSFRGNYSQKYGS